MGGILEDGGYMLNYQDMKQLFKQNVLNDVRKGCSLRKTSKKYNIPINTVSFWCNKAGIKSIYPAPEQKISDREIVAYIKRKGVVKTKQLQNKYHMRNTHILRRLRKLEMKGVITHELLADKRYYRLSEKV